MRVCDIGGGISSFGEPAPAGWYRASPTRCDQDARARGAGRMADGVSMRLGQKASKTFDKPIVTCEMTPALRLPFVIAAYRGIGRFLGAPLG